MEILIIVGGCYALYTVGMAIATELDYRAVNNHRQKSINSLYFIVAYFRVIVNTYKKRLGLQNITGRSILFCEIVLECSLR